MVIHLLLIILLFERIDPWVNGFRVINPLPSRFASKIKVVTNDFSVKGAAEREEQKSTFRTLGIMLRISY
jgi:hypothetical protein